MARINDFLAAFESQYPGVNPSGVYCLFTGKLIGASYELNDFIDSYPDTDPEELADDYALRLFAAMRPSVRWNKLRAETIDEMRKTHPVETLAYLLNRLFTPLNWRGDVFALHHDRIRLYAELERIHTVHREQFDSMLYQLIDLDGMHGVHRLEPTFACEDFLDRFESIEKLVATITAFYEKQTEAYYALLQAQSTQARWIANGSAPSRVARVKQFIESKPPSKTALAREAKAAQATFMSSLLDAILNESPDTPVADIPVAKPAPVVKRTASPTRMLSFLVRKDS